MSPMLMTRGDLERVIKSRRTGRYYVGGGVWTPEAKEAKVFEDLSIAFHTAHNDGLENCCIIVFWSASREVDAQFPIE